MATDTDPQLEPRVPDTQLDALAVIQKLGSGEFIEELAIALTRVAEEAIATKKGGTVTATLKVSPINDEPAVTIIDSIKLGLPAHDGRGAIVYAIGDGFLYKADPRQTVMEFRVVEGTNGNVRVPNLGDGVVREGGN